MANRPSLTKEYAKAITEKLKGLLLWISEVPKDAALQFLGGVASDVIQYDNTLTNSNEPYLGHTAICRLSIALLYFESKTLVESMYTSGLIEVYCAWKTFEYSKGNISPPNDQNIRRMLSEITGDKYNKELARQNRSNRFAKQEQQRIKIEEEMSCNYSNQETQEPSANQGPSEGSTKKTASTSSSKEEDQDSGVSRSPRTSNDKVDRRVSKDTKAPNTTTHVRHEATKTKTDGEFGQPSTKKPTNPGGNTLNQQQSCTTETPGKPPLLQNLQIFLNFLESNFNVDSTDQVSNNRVQEIKQVLDVVFFNLTNTLKGMLQSTNGHSKIESQVTCATTSNNNATSSTITELQPLFNEMCREIDRLRNNFDPLLIAITEINRMLEGSGHSLYEIISFFSRFYSNKEL